ncbi:hypothetical protein DIPPA_35742 [Diplonema papillatum]|nr:hypothetical protein DIPPA_35742 [Diplonema papillatum]
MRLPVRGLTRQARACTAWSTPFSIWYANVASAVTANQKVPVDWERQTSNDGKVEYFIPDTWRSQRAVHQGVEQHVVIPSVSSGLEHGLVIVITKPSQTSDFKMEEKAVIGATCTGDRVYTFLDKAPNGGTYAAVRSMVQGVESEGATRAIANKTHLVAAWTLGHVDIPFHDPVRCAFFTCLCSLKLV